MSSGYEYFYLLRQSNIPGTKDLEIYNQDDFAFDMFLDKLGCYRSNNKCNLHRPVSGEELWSIFSSIKQYLETNYDNTTFFVNTAVPGSSMIQLTKSI